MPLDVDCFSVRWYSMPLGGLDAAPLAATRATLAYQTSEQRQTAQMWLHAASREGGDEETALRMNANFLHRLVGSKLLRIRSQRYALNIVCKKE